MTTIVAAEYEDKAVMIADTLVSADNATYKDPRMSKITESGQYLIGVAGDVGVCNIINHIWKPPAPTIKDKDLFKFVITKTVPSLRAVLDNNSIKPELDFQVLIALKGQVFEIDSDFATTVQDEGLYAIGSGGEYAMGALFYGADPMGAITTAAKLDPKTGGDFQEFVQWTQK
jgi:ATP-dependent protease HslVU (ClpYQ) peptidase subunit